MSRKSSGIFFVIVLSVIQLFGQTGQTFPTTSEAETLTTEVVSLFGQKNYKGALPIAKKVIELRKKEAGDSVLLGAAYSNLAMLQGRLDKPEESLKNFLIAQRIYEKNHPLAAKDELQFATILEEIAYYEAWKGGLRLAEEKYLSAIRIRERLSGKNAPEIARPLIYLVELHKAEFNYEVALPLALRALDIRTAKTGKIDSQSMNIYETSKCLLTKLSRTEEKKRLVERFYPATPEKPSATSSGEIKGGVLNGRALSLPRPKYPKVARSLRIAGPVSVHVVINEDGKILSTCAVSGPRELHEASEDAARQAVFSPTTLSGKPVKVSGVITYNYVEAK